MWTHRFPIPRRHYTHNEIVSVMSVLYRNLIARHRYPIYEGVRSSTYNPFSLKLLLLTLAHAHEGGKPDGELYFWFAIHPAVTKLLRHHHAAARDVWTARRTQWDQLRAIGASPAELASLKLDDPGSEFHDVLLPSLPWTTFLKKLSAYRRLPTVCFFFRFLPTEHTATPPESILPTTKNYEKVKDCIARAEAHHAAGIAFMGRMLTTWKSGPDGGNTAARSAYREFVTAMRCCRRIIGRDEPIVTLAPEDDPDGPGGDGDADEPLERADQRSQSEGGDSVNSDDSYFSTDGTVYPGLCYLYAHAAYYAALTLYARGHTYSACSQILTARDLMYEQYAQPLQYAVLLPFIKDMLTLFNKNDNFDVELLDTYRELEHYTAVACATLVRRDGGGEGSENASSTRSALNSDLSTWQQRLKITPAV
jgi:hypothetical protein